MKRVLRGDHNECPTCGQHFNSTFAFEKHRTGRHGVDRRCLTVTEMEGLGMSLNAGGWWISSAREHADSGSVGDSVARPEDRVDARPIPQPEAA